MVDERTDRIARQAARLIGTGQVAAVADAIRTAADLLGLRDAPLPTHGLVRRHVQGMSMQAMGAEAYDKSVRAVWRLADELMSTIEQIAPGSRPLLVGRAVKGHVDVDARVNVRIHTRVPTHQLVAALVDYGYPEPAFDTADTRFGRFDRVRFEEAGCAVVVTRCLPETIDHAGVDLFTGRPLPSIFADELRHRLFGSFD
jgi:hypothetical protein